MKHKKVFNDPNDYDASGLLFNVLRKRLKLASDAALAKFLEVTQPDISRIRHGREVGAVMILRIHEKTNMPVREIRRLIDAGKVS